MDEPLVASMIIVTYNSAESVLECLRCVQAFTHTPTRTSAPTVAPTSTPTPAPAGVFTGPSTWFWVLPVLAIALAGGYIVINEKRKKGT